MNQDEIKKLIPHRDNMLLVETAQVIDGVSHGTYHVRGDEFFLQGHFPDNPVVPGVILCEMMAQAASVLMAAQVAEESAESGKVPTPMFTSLNNVRFKHPVKPGDTFCSEVSIDRQKGPFSFCSAKGKVNDKVVVTAEFSFALVK